MPVPTVKCPKCGRLQPMPTEGPQGKRWCAGTYCDEDLTNRGSRPRDTEG